MALVVGPIEAARRVVRRASQRSRGSSSLIWFSSSAKVRAMRGLVKVTQPSGAPGGNRAPRARSAVPSGARLS